VKAIWSPLAREQVAEGFAYIAAERPKAAIRWFEELVDKAESLSVFPDQGRMVPEAQRSSLREVLVDPYRLVYRRDETELVVLAVHHARRDLDVNDLES